MWRILRRHIFVLLTRHHLWLESALLLLTKLFFSNQFLFFGRPAIVMVPLVGGKRRRDLVRNRINLGFKSAFTINLFRCLILLQELALVVILIKSFDFVDFRLLTSLGVSCTYNFTV